LLQHGCKKIFTDIFSGGQLTRKGLDEALSYVRTGDTLVVWKLDRLGRSLKHLIDVVNGLNEQGIGFRSLQENMDTTSSGGKLIFHVFGALAEFEREIIRERTQAGLAAARDRGRLGGRPRKMDEKKLKMAVSLMKDPNLSVQEICETLKVSKSTLYRYLNQSNKKGIT
jgi:DNA invertase Pin-like site-specific DNA recombinase